MTNIYTLADELETLKADMQMLKSLLRDRVVITEDMVRRSARARIKRLLPSSNFSLVSTIAILFSLGTFTYSHVVNGTFSLTFLLITWVFLLFCLIRPLFMNNKALRTALTQGSLTEVTTQVKKWSQQVSLNRTLSIIALTIWAMFFFYDAHTDIMQRPASLIVIFIIFLFVISSIIEHQHRVAKTSREVLDEIAEVKK